MSKEMYGPEGVLEIIEQEGFGYGLTEYISPSMVEPEELRNLICAFVEAKAKIEDYLKPYER